jgi:CRISPR type III-A-associated RAMP protein Csm4
MQPALLVRFRPTGPWRIGPESGARNRTDAVLHSDTLYSALSGAALQLGFLDEWLDATARSVNPALRLSSCFPAHGETLYITPPRGLWPPPSSGRVRWKGARYVPSALVNDILAEKPLNEDRWGIDPESDCLTTLERAGKPSGPFRKSARTAAALDRVSAISWPHSTACLEFSEHGGMWAAAVFASEDSHAAWAGRLQGAFRLLADSGLGGERSRGWGHSDPPEFRDGSLAGLLGIREPRPPASGPDQPDQPGESAYWLLSLYAPARDEQDRVQWDRGSYELLNRSGRVESPAQWGEMKRVTRMVSEGSVLVAKSALRGEARDVAPDGAPHPVFRAGFAVSLVIPWKPAPRRWEALLQPAKPKAPEPVPAAEPAAGEPLVSTEPVAEESRDALEPTGSEPPAATLDETLLLDEEHRDALEPTSTEPPAAVLPPQAQEPEA